jgi:lipopolysaccharide biosynthesis protein
MATHWGVEGTVKVGTNAVAEITNWSLNQSVSPVDDTSMGDTWRSHVPGSGIKEWSGTMDCHWDETDTNGQVVLVIGASVTLNLHPEGSTTGDNYFTGTASITERGLDVPMDNGTIKTTFKFQGNGALTPSTVP